MTLSVTLNTLTKMRQRRKTNIFLENGYGRIVGNPWLLCEWIFSPELLYNKWKGLSLLAK